MVIATALRAIHAAVVMPATNPRLRFNDTNLGYPQILLPGDLRGPGSLIGIQAKTQFVVIPALQLAIKDVGRRPGG